MWQGNANQRSSQSLRRQRATAGRQPNGSRRQPRRSVRGRGAMVGCDALCWNRFWTYRSYVNNVIGATDSPSLSSGLRRTRMTSHKHETGRKATCVEYCSTTGLRSASIVQSLEDSQNKKKWSRPGKKSVFPYPPVRWDPVVMSQR